MLHFHNTVKLLVAFFFFQSLSAQDSLILKEFNGELVYRPRFSHVLYEDMDCNKNSIDKIAYEEVEYVNFLMDYYFTIDSTVESFDESLITNIYYFYHPSLYYTHDVYSIIQQTQHLHSYNTKFPLCKYRIELCWEYKNFTNWTLKKTTNKKLSPYWQLIYKKFKLWNYNSYIANSVKFWYIPVAEVELRVINRDATERSNAFKTIKVMSNIIVKIEH